MLRAVLFNEFSYQCPYAYTFGKGYINGGYNCKHSKQREVENVGYNGKKKCGCCYCFSCPLGIEAEQQDLTEKTSPDAICDEIDWDGFCENGEVADGEYLLVEVGESATEEQKEAMWNYELHINRYNRHWLDEHGIANSLYC